MCASTRARRTSGSPSPRTRTVFLHLTIRDDGIGFDPDRVPRLGRQHFGLLIMRERVESFGGALTIVSAPGAGTTIRATLPNAAAARGAA